MPTANDLTELHRERLEDLYLRVNARFDFADRIITLSTGALALSVTFRKSFSEAAPNHIWLLGLSWILFVTSVATGLVVLHLRTSVYLLIARQSGIIPETHGYRRDPWKIFHRLRFFEITMFTTFSAAIAVFAAFALWNLR